MNASIPPNSQNHSHDFGFLFLTVVLFVLVLSVDSVVCQNSTDLPASINRSIGVYKVFEIANRSDESVETLMIRLPRKRVSEQEEPDPVRRRLSVSGEIRLVNGKVFEFESAFLKPVMIDGDEYIKGVSIQTKQVGETSFEFVGEFLDNMVQDASDKPFIKLKGRLTRIAGDDQRTTQIVRLFEEASM